MHYLSSRIAVMYRGRIVELGGSDALFDHPAHPYTQALLDAAPVADYALRGRNRVLRIDHPNHRIQRKSFLRHIVAEDVPPDGIDRSGGQGRLLLLGFPQRIRPLHLAPLARAVRISDPDLVRQPRRGPGRGIHKDGIDLMDGLVGAAGRKQDDSEG